MCVLYISREFYFFFSNPLFLHELVVHISNNIINLEFTSNLGSVFCDLLLVFPFLFHTYVHLLYGIL